MQYDGNWDPEPGGWRRLSAILRNKQKIQLNITDVKLGSNKLGIGHGVGIKVAHLTGTTRFKLSADQRQELKVFVEGGGRLIIDAAGGSTDFSTSAEQELQAIFGADAVKQLSPPLSQKDPLFKLPGLTIETFNYRSYARSTLVGSNHAPLLSAISINGKPAVFYSKIDLSAGLVGEPMDGIIGYDPPTATAIMTNLLVSSD